MAAITIYSDAWWTLIGVGVAALVVVAALLFMRWESKHATRYYEKRTKKK
jgi:hypothetical protein